jgi:chemotaxis protein CheD
VKETSAAIENALPRVFLHPGEGHFTDKAVSIHTILGSCVALTMRDPVSGRAAMCHCLLPTKPGLEDGGLLTDDAFRYVDSALEALLGQFRWRDVPAARLEIKLFGGANVLQTISGEHAVGPQNWRQAQLSLETLHLPILAQDIGGEVARRLIFVTGTGAVLVKRLAMDSHAKRARRKASYFTFLT